MSLREEKWVEKKEQPARATRPGWEHKEQGAQDRRSPTRLNAAASGERTRYIQPPSLPKRIWPAN